MDYFYLRQKEPKVIRSIRVPADLDHWLKTLSRSTRISYTQLVNQCIRFAMEHAAPFQEESQENESF